MQNPFSARAAISLVTAHAGAAVAASTGGPREFLGQAAFGLQQLDVMLAALAALIVVFVVSTVSRKERQKCPTSSRRNGSEPWIDLANFWKSAWAWSRSCWNGSGASKTSSRSSW